MVEVFKTNVKHPHQAIMLVDQIQKVFGNYIANFDLEDCDNILRVKCNTGLIKSAGLINLISELGFHAEILPDEPSPFQSYGLTAVLFRTSQLN